MAFGWLGLGRPLRPKVGRSAPFDRLPEPDVGLAVSFWLGWGQLRTVCLTSSEAKEDLADTLRISLQLRSTEV